MSQVETRLNDVESELVRMAVGQRDAVKQAADLEFERRAALITRKLGIADGVRVNFKSDPDGSIFVTYETGIPESKPDLAEEDVVSPS